MILLFALAMAYEPVAVLEKQIQSNLDGLTLDGSPPIYHLRYKLYELEQRDLELSFGAEVRASSRPMRSLGVEVRVGDAAYDNTGFGIWSGGFSGSRLPLDPDDLALERAAWRLTDRAWRDAIEQYARKEAQAPSWDGRPPDYTMVDAISYQESATPLQGIDQLEASVRAVGAQLAAYPELELARVTLGAESGTLTVVDSDGTSGSRAMMEATVRAVAHLRLPDGSLLTDQRLWTAKTAEGLPDQATMVGAVDAMVLELHERAKLPVWVGEYVGPVVFEDEAAVELFRRLLLPQLMGTRPEESFETWLGSLGSGGGGAVIGRRLLPAGWGVADDPRADLTHPACFSWDDEGVESRRVETVRDGILVEPLRTRTPDLLGATSNGHARASMGSPAIPRASWVEVVTPKLVSEKTVDRLATKAAGVYGQEGYIRIRRVQDAATRLPLYGPDAMLDDDDGFPAPLEVVMVTRDGETAYRGARFAGMDRWALRDISAAFGGVEADMLEPFSGSYLGAGATQGTVVHIVAPEVLVGEVILASQPGQRNRASVLAPVEEDP